MRLILQCFVDHAYLFSISRVRNISLYVAGVWDPGFDTVGAKDSGNQNL
jgi:hypothetical protein